MARSTTAECLGPKEERRRRLLGAAEDVGSGNFGPEVEPEVPATAAVLPLSTSGGNFRRHFRLFSSGTGCFVSPGFRPEIGRAHV